MDKQIITLTVTLPDSKELLSASQDIVVADGNLPDGITELVQEMVYRLQEEDNQK
jgi:hypothetical protein